MGSARVRIRTVPALDGLRGLAVLGVVLFHLGGSIGLQVRGGYLGVDLFFVLSGFLITALLVVEADATGAVDLRAFWLRRARRLLPAVLALMPAIALYGLVFAGPDEVSSLRKDALATLAYVANWRAILDVKSYWDLFVAPSPLEHTWSLAIEEQFYVVWPLLFVLLAVRLRLSRAALLAVTLVLAVVSGVLMWRAFDPQNTNRAYFGTDTRAAAILVGAALAFALGPTRLVDRPVLPARRAAASSALGWLGIVGLAIAWARLEGREPLLYRGAFWLSELACVAVIAAIVLSPESALARALSLAPLRAVGKISYGVYLWHWPIFCVLTRERLHLGYGAVSALRLATTLVVATVSYAYFEHPIRERGLPFRRPAALTFAAFAAAVGLVVVGTRPKPPVSKFITTSPSASPSARAPGSAPDPFATALRDLPRRDELPPGTLRVLTLGDSVSEKVGWAMRVHQWAFQAWVADRSVGACSMMESLVARTDQPLGHPNPAWGCARGWVKDTAELRPDVTLIVFGGAFLHYLTVDGVYQGPCGKGFQWAQRARYEQLLTEMGDHPGLVVIATIPYPNDRWRGAHTLEDVDCYNAMLRDIAKAHNFPVIEMGPKLCPTPDCHLLGPKGDSIRPDGLHPEVPGADDWIRWTFQELQRIVLERGPRADAGPNR